MNKPLRGDINNTRLLTIQEATLYWGLSRNTARRYFDDIGAIRRIGGSIRVDKRALDKALDSMAGTQSISAQDEKNKQIKAINEAIERLKEELKTLEEE